MNNLLPLIGGIALGSTAYFNYRRGWQPKGSQVIVTLCVLQVAFALFGFWTASALAQGASMLLALVLIVASIRHRNKGGHR